MSSSPEPGPTIIEPPHIPMPTETLVLENGDRQLLWFDGFVPLPIGSRIELTNRGDLKVPLDPERFPGGSADAVVTGMRVWGTQGGASSRCLVLDVELTWPTEPGTWMLER